MMCSFMYLWCMLYVLCYLYFLLGGDVGRSVGDVKEGLKCSVEININVEWWWFVWILYF